MRSLEEFASRVDQLSREDFVREYPHPALVLEAALNKRAVWSYKTSRISKGRPENAGKASSLASYAVVHIEPQAGHAWGNRISVGRASNNDIILADASVSKLHAYFALAEDGSVTLRDMESRNGTTVAGVALQPGETKGVRSGEEIRFGAISGLVLSSGDLYDFVRTRLYPGTATR